MNLKYAEMLYTMGSGNNNLDNLYLARKYFSHSLVLKEDYPRALWGLLQTCKIIQSLAKKEDEKN